MGELSPEMVGTQGDYRNITGLEPTVAWWNTATILHGGSKRGSIGVSTRQPMSDGPGILKRIQPPKRQGFCGVAIKCWTERPKNSMKVGGANEKSRSCYSQGGGAAMGELCIGVWQCWKPEPLTMIQHCHTPMHREPSPTRYFYRRTRLVMQKCAHQVPRTNTGRKKRLGSSNVYTTENA